MGNKQIDLFLDSGAFSAFTKSISINIDDYIEFIKKYKNYLTVYANLDVIGDPLKTWRNQKYMESRGLKPLPVFHTTREDTIWLQKYLDAGYEYIALGGMAGGDVPKRSIIKFLDRVWSDFLVDLKGFPKVKVHGFGIGSVDLILRYPWYSVDSTTWVMVGRMGGVLVPQYNNITCSYTYNKIPWKIAVSDKSPSQKEKFQHYNTLSRAVKVNIDKYFDEKGVTIEQLSTDYKKRDELNITYFVDFEKANSEVKPFKVKTTKGFF